MYDAALSIVTKIYSSHQISKIVRIGRCEICSRSGIVFWQNTEQPLNPNWRTKPGATRRNDLYHYTLLNSLGLPAMSKLLDWKHRLLCFKIIAVSDQGGDRSLLAENDPPTAQLDQRWLLLQGLSTSSFALYRLQVRTPWIWKLTATCCLWSYALCHCGGSRWFQFQPLREVAHFPTQHLLRILELSTGSKVQSPCIAWTYKDTDNFWKSLKILHWKSSWILIVGTAQASQSTARIARR